MAAKTSRTSKKAPRTSGRQARASRPAGGGRLVKLFFWMALLGGVGYAGLRVPFSGRTLAAHVRAQPWSEWTATARGLFPSAQPPSSAEPPAVHAGAAETLTAADRRALEDLLPR